MFIICTHQKLFKLVNKSTGTYQYRAVTKHKFCYINTVPLRYRNVLNFEKKHRCRYVETIHKSNFGLYFLSLETTLLSNPFCTRALLNLLPLPVPVLLIPVPEPVFRDVFLTLLVHIKDRLLTIKQQAGLNI